MIPTAALGEFEAPEEVLVGHYRGGDHLLEWVEEQQENLWLRWQCGFCPEWLSEAMECLAENN